MVLPLNPTEAETPTPRGNSVGIGLAERSEIVRSKRLTTKVTQNLAVIAAMARNRGIGMAGQLPWHVPSDLKRFKRLTSGHAVIMGRKTFESIGRPLPNRRNIVVTQSAVLPSTVETARSLEEAIEMAKDDELPFVIGGAELYSRALDVATHLYLTELDLDFKSDTFFPIIDSTCWNEIAFERGPGLCFRDFVRADREVSDMSVDSVGVGKVVDGRYKLEQQIGTDHGSMGAVFVARDIAEKRDVVLKFCVDESEEARRRFGREVRATEKFEGQAGVVQILAKNLLHDPPYFVMPRAKHSIVSELSRLSEDHKEAMSVVVAICKGVIAIHHGGTTHRDLKPSNVLRMQNDSIVVSDLGLAKFSARDSTVLTQTDVFLGTRAYAAPEQLLRGGAREADKRTDVYQLGRMIYEIFTGDDPAIVDPTKLPAGLASIVRRATRESPDDRFKDVNALLQALTIYSLTTSETATVAQRFEAALAVAENNLRTNSYVSDNLVTLVSELADFDDGSFLEAFDRIPERLLPIFVASVRDEFMPCLERYVKCVNEQVDGRSFSYAEVVARKCRLMFDAKTSAEVRGCVVVATLIAAVRLNRFAAMAVFDEMLMDVEQVDAVEVASRLSDFSTEYATLAERVPAFKLQPALQIVRSQFVQ